MRIEWLNKKGNSRVILFFNGWGMDSNAVAHLKTSSDLIVFSDYRNISKVEIPSFESYTEICLVAWSMGVWAAANVVPRMNIRLHRLVALNGTECPVDDENGIPLRVYELTEKGMNEKGRNKFMQRMFEHREHWEHFNSCLPQRLLDEVCEELVLIHNQCRGMKNTLQWDKAYLSAKDLIFPVDNQKNWWQDKCPSLQILPGGHYPFYQFDSWEEILDK